MSQVKQAGTTAAEIEAALPRAYWVRRGHIMAAFGLSRSAMEALVPGTFAPDPNPNFKYARFVRSQVVAVARRWEREHPAA